MSTDKRSQAARALHRFGFGPREGSIDAIASDPRGALLAELERDPARGDDSELPSSGAAARAAFAFRQERRAARLAQGASQGKPAEQEMATGPGGDAAADPYPDRH